MSRTLNEIYDAIASEKANMAELNDWIINTSNPESKLDDHQTLLDDLTSTSKVAIWRLMLWVAAVAIWIHEGLWDVFKSETDAIIAADKVHTLPWYQQACFHFQYGDQLTWNNGYDYATIDPAKQIIKYAAAVEVSGIVRLKVATDVNGIITSLSSGQLAAFQNYMEKYKDAGVILDIISLSPDLLHIEYDIIYDPALLNADGSLITDSSTFPVQDAILNYIKNLDFNGKFRLESCDAAVRSAIGVIDFQRTLAKYKSAQQNYADINLSVIAYAGSFKIDTNYPLSDTLTYNV